MHELSGVLVHEGIIYCFIKGSLSVVNEQLVASPWLGELAKGPPSSSLSPLFSQCEAHGPPIAVGREKKNKIVNKLEYPYLSFKMQISKQI